MKLIFVILGILSLILGIVGVALPLLPTTPFLLLSATLFAHSSPRLYGWLLNHRLFGKYIRDYREKRALSPRLKIAVISLLWVTILLSIFVIARHTLWIDILLLAVGIGVTWHIASLGNSNSE